MHLGQKVSLSFASLRRSHFSASVANCVNETVSGRVDGSIPAASISSEVTSPESALRMVFRRFWGPIPWMIETAALLSALVQKWED